MSGISTVPAVLDALVASTTAAQPGVQVVDGQPYQVDNDIICFGFTGEPGEPVVVSTLTREQMAASPSREAYDISSLASSLKGDGSAETVRAVRDQAFAMVAGVVALLAADPTLGGACGRSELRSESFVQAQTQDGAAATVSFVIHVDAFTR